MGHRHNQLSVRSARSTCWVFSEAAQQEHAFYSVPEGPRRSRKVIRCSVSATNNSRQTRHSRPPPLPVGHQHSRTRKVAPRNS
jgi:hypothetical protein